jgi:hypothetical protein
MKKITPSDLRRLAQAMLRDGSMPTLETLLEAVAEAREKYAQTYGQAESRKDGVALSRTVRSAQSSLVQPSFPPGGSSSGSETQFYPSHSHFKQ